MTETAQEHGTALVARATRQTGVVVLLHSWWGLTGHFRDLAGRLAAGGLTTVAADLYGGATTDDPVRARELRVALSDEDAAARTGAAVDRARRLSGGAPVGVLGFSMGAEFALRAGAARGGQIGAVTAFYGLCVPEGLSGLTGPVQAHVATDDEFVTPAEAGEFVERFLAAGKRVELHTYPGTRHAFFNPTRPEAYDPAAADRAWHRTVDFLSRTLAG